LPHLWDANDQARGALDIKMEAWLSTEKMRAAGSGALRVTAASTRDLYWTPGQMVAHHTSNGCNLRPGDLLGTGTVSSPGEHGHGSMLEMTQAGRNPLSLPNGETRRFLEEGDEVTLRAFCERPGFARIGLGEVKGQVARST
jgi:fumarylacetoacetase